MFVEHFLFHVTMYLHLGVGVNFRPCSEGYFLSGRPKSHFFNHLIKHFSNNTNVFLPQLMFSTLIFLWKQEKCDVPSTKSFSQWSPRICAPIYEQWNACEMGTFQWKIAYIMLKPLLQSHRKWVGRVGKDFLFELGKKPHMHLVEIGIFDRHFTSWS